MSVTATSRVATERGERYRKQLASHFGNKIEVVEEPAGTVLMWGFGGSTTLTVEDDALVMRADAEDAETLDRVKDVTGRTWNASARRTAWPLPGSNFTVRDWQVPVPCLPHDHRTGAAAAFRA